MITQKNNITQLTIISPCANYFKDARVIQTKIGAQQDFEHLMQIRLYFYSREPIKKRKALKIILLLFFTYSCRVVTKSHTYLNKPAAGNSGLLKCV